MRETGLAGWGRVDDHVERRAAVELEVGALDFSTYLPEWNAMTPRWRDYYYAHDQRPHYAYMKTVLKILQWAKPRDRWVLKSPQHLEQLGPLLAAFPDARIVQTHRGPVRVTASFCTLGGCACSDRSSPDLGPARRIVSGSVCASTTPVATTFRPRRSPPCP